MMPRSVPLGEMSRGLDTLKERIGVEESRGEEVKEVMRVGVKGMRIGETTDEGMGGDGVEVSHGRVGPIRGGREGEAMDGDKIKGTGEGDGKRIGGRMSMME